MTSQLGAVSCSRPDRPRLARCSPGGAAGELPKTSAHLSPPKRPAVVTRSTRPAKPYSQHQPNEKEM